MSIEKKSIAWGIAGALLLIVFYFSVLTLAESFSHALEQFRLLWYWIVTLIIGFGIQVGLYAYIRIKIHERKINTADKEVAASAGISTGSMIACCAHHLVDVLPILGLSAVFLFLAKYQLWFIFVGIAANVIGIIFMLEIIKKHSLHTGAGLLELITQANMKKLRNRTIAGAILILLIAFFWIKNSPIQDALPPVLTSRINDEGGLSIEAQPIDFSFEKPLRFGISLNSHQGDLDFDLAKQSILIDDRSKKYPPLEWQGGRGGHHLSGLLIFPNIPAGTKKITLVINNIYGVKERIFEWDI